MDFHFDLIGKNKYKQRHSCAGLQKVHVRFNGNYYYNDDY